MTIKEFLLSALIPTLEAMGEPYLEQLLEKLNYADADEFTTDIQGSYSLFSRLDALAKTTKTPVDDGITETVLEAIVAVAKAHNIELPAQ